MAAGGGYGVFYPYKSFIKKIAKKLPTYCKVEDFINELFSKFSRDSPYELTEPLEQLVARYSANPEFRSYALWRSLGNNNIGLFYKLFDSYVFDPTDDYVIFKAIQQVEPKYIRILLDCGFKFGSNDPNPFDILVQSYELYLKYDDNTSNKWRDIIDIFSMLIDAGYNIHQSNDEAFCHCTNVQILEYMLSRDTDISKCGYDWLKNYSKSNQYIPYDALQLMLDNGLDIDIGDGMLVKHAFREMNCDLIKFIDSRGYNFKEKEFELMNLFGSVTLNSDYSMIHEISEIMIKHDFDLNRLKTHIICTIIYHHLPETLRILISGGFDLQRRFTGHDISTGTADKIETYKILVDNGVPIEKVLDLI